MEDAVEDGVASGALEEACFLRVAIVKQYRMRTGE